MLPFQAEPLEQLQARFHKVFEKIWEVTDVMTDRPGMHREHTFDFESGLRLLISLDRLPSSSEEELHISASWEKDSPTQVLDAHGQVVRAYESLGGKGEVLYVGMSNNRIPHWWVMDYVKVRTH